MDPVFGIILLLSLAVCLYMAWNIGANDVANAMGTSVGSRALTLKQAVILAAVFEFAGAFLAGDAVTDTVRKGILQVDFDSVTAEFTTDLMFGFIAAMMAAAVWLTIATRFGLPVSTTHSIIGGIIGVGLILEIQHSTSLIDWGVVRKVAISWVASPLIGGLLAFLTFSIVRVLILDAPEPTERARWLAPLLALPTFFVLGLALQFKALKGLISRLDSAGVIESKYNWLPVRENGTWNPMADNAWFPINSLLLALTIAIAASFILGMILRRYEFKQDGFHGVERVFVWLQIITAAYVAFAHGANDFANAIGPMATVHQVLTSGGEIAAKTEIPVWLILIGSTGIAVGVLTWGWRVMETVGKKITDITPTRGFAAEFGAATTILIFTMPFLAVPVSTTHTLVGAVVGVGLAGGTKAVNFRVFGKIFTSWVVSLPAAGFGAIVLYVFTGSDPLMLLVVIPLSFVGVGIIVYRTRDEPVHVEDALADVGGGVDKASTPLELFYAHAESVEDTVNKMLEALSVATKGGDATDAIEATITAELLADELKMTLRDAIGARELMLIIESGSFFHMLSRQDRIADYAQNVAEQLSFRELYDDERALELLQEMGEAVARTVKDYVRTVKVMRDLSLSGFTKEQRQNLRELIKQVNLREHEADEVESRAAAFVFGHGEDEPLAAMHMYRVLQRLDDVANACEKAANAFLPIAYR